MVLFQLLCGSGSHPFLSATELRDKSLLEPKNLARKVMMATQIIWPRNAESHLSCQFRDLMEGFLQIGGLGKFGLPEVCFTYYLCSQSGSVPVVVSMAIPFRLNSPTGVVQRSDHRGPAEQSGQSLPLWPRLVPCAYVN